MDPPRDTNDDDDEVLYDAPVPPSSGATTAAMGAAAGSAGHGASRAIPGVLAYVPPPIASSKPYTIEVNSSTYGGGAGSIALDDYGDNDPMLDYDSKEQPLLLEHNTGHFRGVVTIRKYRDVLFAVIYLLALLAMVISGIVVRASSRVPLDPVAGSLSYMVFDVLRGSLGILAAVIVLESVVGALWLLIVRSYVKVCVWGTMITTPILLLGFGIWTLSLAVPHTGTTVVGWFSIVGGVVCILALVFMFRRLDVTVSLFRLATSVLMEHFDLFWVAIVTSAAFLSFASLWIFLFGSLFLLGNAIIDPNTGLSTWTVDPTSYIALCFYLLMFLWTTAIVYNIQVYVISGTTCQWYFHRRELGRSRHNPVLESGKRALSTSFGSICLAALILAIVQLLRFILQRFVRRNRSGELDIFSRIILGCANGLETIVMQISHLSVAYMALTGTSFFPATRSVVEILQRNLLDRVVIDWAAHVVLWVWSAAISAFCSFGVYLYAVNILQSPYSWVTALVSFSVAHSVMQFYSRLLLNVIDALFLCYAMDCDGALERVDPGNSNPEVHELLGKYFESQRLTRQVQLHGDV